MVWESILLVFLLALGTLQVIASCADFKGISFFKHRVIGYIFGAAQIIGAFTWFFIIVEDKGGPRGQHDDQTLSTLVGGGLALLLTWFISSIAKYKSGGPSQAGDEVQDGVETFKYMTFLQAIRYRSSVKRKDK